MRYQLLALVAVAFGALGQPVTPQGPPPPTGPSSPAPNCSPVQVSITCAAGKPSIASTVPPSAIDSLLTAADPYLDALEKLLKVLAYVVGVLWVYYNYFKGRTHQLRVDSKIQATTLPSPNEALCKVTRTLKNVGLTKVTLLKYGSALRVEAYDSTAEKWQHISTYDIFEKNSVWLEPGETLEETTLLHLAEPLTRPFRVQLLANGGKFTWETSNIVQTDTGEKK